MGTDSFRYGCYNRPELQKSLALLRLDLTYTHATGDFVYYLKEGKESPALDMVGGYGSTILGHNHPAIKKTAVEFLETDRVIHAQASIRSQASLLAESLSQLLDTPYVTTLANTGTEAIEAAIKHALMEWQTKRQKTLVVLHSKSAGTSDVEVQAQIEFLIHAIETTGPVLLALEGGFHGKTAGSVSATCNSVYSDMYPSRPVHTEFIRPDLCHTDLETLFENYSIQLNQEYAFNSVIGVCIELIQGEGGIQCLPQEFVSNLSLLCQKRDIPVIVDEIQTGLYRTGKFIASEWYRIQPDYLALGKSLGGGIAKIAALLIKTHRYQGDFGLVHSSTFAEDDFSSSIALKTLNLLNQDSTIGDRALQFENFVGAVCQKLSIGFPGVIREARGRGWMMGIEFSPIASESAPIFLNAIMESGLNCWFYASYLLHRHGIRVAVTLSQAQTIRLEPSAYISEENLQQFARGLSALVEKIHERRWGDIVSHIWPTKASSITPVHTPAQRVPRLKAHPGQKKVFFLSHIIDLDNFRKIAPFMAHLNSADVQKLTENIDRWGNAVNSHQQIIHASNGNSILFELHGMPASTEFFEKSVREKDLRAYRFVKSAVLKLLDQDVSYLGLGQYTSIVSDNGLLLTRFLSDSDMKMTTGNSFTVGLAYLGLLSLLKERKLALGNLRVGLVGVAGNICNVYAQILGDAADALTLIHREPFDQSPKFQAAVAKVVGHSKAKQENMKATSELGDLVDCDVVILGTNTALQFLLPSHLKESALVLDISVPSNIHPSVLSERPDVHCFQGGYAALPMNQQFETNLLPIPDGQIFACMAETMMTGLSSFPGHFSLGPVSKDQVFRSLEMAESLGFGLGSIKQQRIM